MEVGVNIFYMVTGGKSLKKFHNLVCSEPCKDIKLTYFIMIFASVHSVLYSTIAWAASLDKGVQPNMDYSYKAHSTTGRVFIFFNALGTIAFAYAGHNVVLEIQATIPLTRKACKDQFGRSMVALLRHPDLLVSKFLLLGFGCMVKYADSLVISLYSRAVMVSKFVR
ncbi:lysine histidine transporter 1-like protein [Tanacetum coccineum]